MNPRIMFLRDNRYRPVGCVAISIDSRNHRLNYQFSVLNPVDKFDRKMARHLALGRMVENPIHVTIPRDKTLNMHVVSDLVMQHLAQSNAPSRAVKAAKQWIQTRELLLNWDSVQGL